ncbi:MAG: MarC family protein [Acidobacteriota bacterium]
MIDALVAWIDALGATAGTFVVSILGLYIVVNPAAVASVFLGLTKELPAGRRRGIALRATVIAAVILTMFALAGTTLLAKLQVTAAALQIAGGIFIFGLAYALARGKEREFFGAYPEAGPEASVARIAMCPLAVPMMAGPASITLVMTSSAKAGNDPYAWAALLTAIAVTCLLCLLSMWRWIRLEEKHGRGFSLVITRIMGLVLAVIAVQFILDGIGQVLPRLLALSRASGPGIS